MDTVHNNTPNFLKVAYTKKGNQGKKALDYYPFGMPMQGRTFDNDRYRYGFNGKENDNEVKGPGNQQDYGMRIYDPRLGRFLSTDPLTRDYPELTPYQFASNTPIIAVDLDGMEAFFIHGTTNTPQDWAKDNTPLMKNLLALTNNKTVDASFAWNIKNAHGHTLNGITNNTDFRAHAANLLVNHIMEYRKQNKITDEEITLIGFSHGGNVAIQTAQLLHDNYGIKVNIINVNTPVYNGDNDPENPARNEGINDMIHFYTDGDAVAGPGAGAGSSDDKYSDTPLFMNSLKQIQLIPKQGTAKNLISPHFLNNVNAFSKQIMSARKLSGVWSGEKNPENNYIQEEKK